MALFKKIIFILMINSYWLNTFKLFNFIESQPKNKKLKANNDLEKSASNDFLQSFNLLKSKAETINIDNSRTILQDNTLDFVISGNAHSILNNPNSCNLNTNSQVDSNNNIANTLYSDILAQEKNNMIESIFDITSFIDPSQDPIEIFFYYKPNEIQSTELYSPFTELAAKYLYLNPYLNLSYNSVFEYLSKVSNLSKIKNCDYEKSLISLVDNLIEFNKNFKSPDFNFLIRSKTLYLKYKSNFRNSANPYTLEMYIKDCDMHNQNADILKKFIQISDQISDISDAKIKMNWRFTSWCYMFSTINQINEYYNQQMRIALTPTQIISVFSLLKIPKHSLDCSKYVSTDNFLAYCIFDLLIHLNTESYQSEKNDLLSLRRILEKILKPNINILLFIFLNQSSVISTLLNNKEIFRKFKKEIENNFQVQYSNKFNLEMALDKYKKIKEFDCNQMCHLSSRELDKIIEKISQIIKNHILEFYTYTYEILKKVLSDEIN